MESLQRKENATHDHDFKLATSVGMSLKLNKHLGNTFISTQHPKLSL